MLERPERSVETRLECGVVLTHSDSDAFAEHRSVLKRRTRKVEILACRCAQETVDGCLYFLHGCIQPASGEVRIDLILRLIGNNLNAFVRPVLLRIVGLHSALYAIPALAVAASLVLFAASRTVTGDMRKQERNHQA